MIYCIICVYVKMNSRQTDSENINSDEIVSEICENYKKNNKLCLNFEQSRLYSKNLIVKQKINNLHDKLNVNLYLIKNNNNDENVLKNPYKLQITSPRILDYDPTCEDNLDYHLYLENEIN